MTIPPLLAHEHIRASGRKLQVAGFANNAK